MTNFAEMLAANAAAAPDRPVLKLEDRTWTYSELDRAIARMAGVLRGRGIGRGDRVAVQLPTSPQFPIVMFGTLRLGGVIVPLNPLLKGREVAYHLSDSGAKVIIAGHELADAAKEGSAEVGIPCVIAQPTEFEALLSAAEPVAQIEPREDSDTGLLIYTSGTTGKPKGAALTHAELRAASSTGKELCGVGPSDVALITLPLFHVFGLLPMLCSMFAAGGLCTLVPRFDPGKVLEVLERDRVTLFGGVPTMYTAILHHPDRAKFDLTSVNFCISGGAPIPVEVLRGFEQAFGCTVLEGYGLSETGGVATFNLPDRERKAGSIGVPVLGTEVRIVDHNDQDLPDGERGELIMRGPTVMAGYWNKPEATADAIQDGWFYTGDIAIRDGDGYFFIVDRKKDLVIRGGYNIYPREIEEVLYEHPAVREAAVIGVPHESLGEEVAAVVSLKDGAELDPDTLRAYMKERVAAYKYPRIVRIVDELPKGPTGKILKREIKIPAEGQPAH